MPKCESNNEFLSGINLQYTMVPHDLFFLK